MDLDGGSMPWMGTTTPSTTFWTTRVQCGTDPRKGERIRRIDVHPRSVATEAWKKVAEERKRRRNGHENVPVHLGIRQRRTSGQAV